MPNTNQKIIDKRLAEKLEMSIKAILKKDKDIISNNQIVNEENVYQKARKDNRSYIFELLSECVKPDSKIIGIENWDQFYAQYKAGSSSLIFAEHKSNLDVLIFDYMMSLLGKNYEEAFNEIVFIAGRRLNEDSLTVKLFAELYTRLIVVAKVESQNASEAEMETMYKINYASQSYLKTNIKNHIYFLYPTGTRARVWDHSTYKALTESVNYLKKFDQVIFLSVDGNCMFPLPNISMDSEPVIQDTITLRFSKPKNVHDFIEEEQKKLEQLQQKTDEKLNIKTLLTKKIEDNIYNQKPVLPWEEPWVKIYQQCLKILENKTDNK